jgi:hypothetical protein
VAERGMSFTVIPTIQELFLWPGYRYFDGKRSNILTFRTVQSGSEMGVINKFNITQIDVTYKFILDTWSLF